MTLVSLQQDFLPTDTVVDIPKILNQAPELMEGSSGPFLIASLIGVFGLMLLMGCATGKSVNNPRYQKIFIGMVVSGILALFLGIALFMNAQSDYQSQIDDNRSKVDEFNDAEKAYFELVKDQRDKNRANLLSNIESVYDVERIEIDPDGLASLTSANSEGKIGDKVITRKPFDLSVEAVVFQDGKAYDVLLTQDPDTYEPLLSVRTSTYSDAPVIRKK